MESTNGSTIKNEIKSVKKQNNDYKGGVWTIVLLLAMALATIVYNEYREKHKNISSYVKQENVNKFLSQRTR